MVVENGFIVLFFFFIGGFSFLNIFEELSSEDFFYFCFCYGRENYYYRLRVRFFEGWFVGVERVLDGFFERCELYFV